MLTHAIEPVKTALTAAAVGHTGSWARFTGLSTVFVAGLVIGLLSLVYSERWTRDRDATRADRRYGPGDGR